MIIVFGSINLDIVTRVPRLPGPGETVKGDAYKLIPGGKGANQALAAKRAGSDTAMVGAVGDDAFAALALEFLEMDGVDLTGVARVSEPTGIASINVDDNGENAIAVAGGANTMVVSAQFDESSPEAGGFLLTQNEIPESEILRVHAKAKAKGFTNLHNAAPAGPLSDSALANIDWLIVNETEAIIVAHGAGIDAGDSPKAAAKALAEKSGNNVIVTLGPEGAFSYGPAGEHYGGSLPVEVKDTTAAGDTFTGAFAAALDQGFDVGEALARAAAAGSLACTVFGAQPSIPHKAAIDAVF